MPAEPQGKSKNTGVGSFSSPADLPDPGIEPGSPALQMDSLLTELSGKPDKSVSSLINLTLINLGQIRRGKKKKKKFTMNILNQIFFDELYKLLIYFGY